MPFQISTGSRGRFRASGIEFEVVDASQTAVTKIRYRYEKELVEVADDALREAADNIEGWGK